MENETVTKKMKIQSFLHCDEESELLESKPEKGQYIVSMTFFPPRWHKYAHLTNTIIFVMGITFQSDEN
jgi:hypothetical protein